MSRHIKIISATFLTFSVYYLLDKIYFNELWSYLITILHHVGVSHFITYMISGIPIFISIYFIHGYKNLMHSLGFGESILKGIFIPLIFTLPMFIGFSFLFKFNTEINLDDFLIKVVSAAFFEELFFRGFLFGQLARYTRFGFFPSVFLGALFFGIIHLYQSKELYESLGIFTITFLGGILFAWLFAEWSYNIWFPVFLHFFMNLAWFIFSASDNALGGVSFNVFRTLTVLAAIVITIMYKKKKGLKFEVNKKTIWYKQSVAQ